MLQTTVRVTTRPRPWRLLAWFTAAFALVWVSGRAYEHRVLGRTDEEGRRLVADGCERNSARSASRSNRPRAPASRRLDLMRRAPGDLGAARDLFAELAAISESNVAISVYGSDAAPLAWSGRPSELPGARISGPAALLVAPGPRDSGSCWCVQSPPAAPNRRGRPAPSSLKSRFRPAGRPAASDRRRSPGRGRPCRWRFGPDTRAAASRGRQKRLS